MQTEVRVPENPGVTMHYADISEWACFLARQTAIAPVDLGRLRHAFAQRVLAANKSLKTVADLLGHRALSSVAVYAKVDEQRLREVALEWPEVSA